MSSILGRKKQIEVDPNAIALFPEIDGMVKSAIMQGAPEPTVDKPALPEVDAMVQQALMGKAPAPVPELSPMANIPEMPDVPPLPAMPKRAPAAKAEAPAAMNPAIKEYIAKKYGFDGAESDEALMRAQERGDDSRFLANMASAGNTVGAAIAGVKADNSFYDKLRDGAGQGVKDLQDRRKGKMDDMVYGKALKEQEAEGSEDDPNSDMTMRLRELASRMSPKSDFSKMSASQIKRVLPTIEKLYEADQRSLDRKESRDERRAMFGLTQAEKKRTEDDKKKAGMFEIEDRRQQIGAALDSLDAMIADKGTFEALGSHNQDMDRLVEQVATDMAKLQDPSSIARPSEVEMIKKSLVQSGFQNSNDTARKILKNFRGEVERRAQGAYKVRGLEAPAAKTGGFPRKVRKGNQTATVQNEAELKEAMSEGFN